jgi:nitrogen regulatory protein PII-like uncharacterized protein
MNTKVLIKAIGKDKLLSMIEEATTKMFDLAAKTAEGPSERAKMLLDVITKECSFGCNESNVVKVIEAVTGENLKSFYKVKTVRLTPIEFAAFKVINEHDDDFECGQIGIVIDSENDSCTNISIDGDCFEYELTTPDPEDVVPLTSEEIIETVDKLISICE